ncbi:MAG: A/G-specific adenine glycosylase [Caldilineales bacterium]|nr:A/G-specific adenine glycosylase [Caldilineales bacterium]MDW8319614.1 A/G-specific adenine glycosylase [Anaerolineae bacterium]
MPVPSAIASALLAWADQGGLRDLPWRTEPRDPYVVWISEVMLQQTQVSTVTPYLQRWLERFPTVEALAAANLDDVLKAWEGLGYYSRARNLHRAAQVLVKQHGGRLPADRQALLALPGIGKYTAGAILSIAFGRRAAVLDGNVKRVLARVYDVDEEIGRSAAARRLWQLAEALVEAVEPAQAGRLNEALMDLGATVCLPQRPRCLVCPLHGLCLARQRGTQEERPVRRRRKPLPHFDVTAAVLRRPGHSDQFLIAQRPPEGMLGGLWEFPGGKCHDGEPLADCLRRELAEELGVEATVGRLVTVVEHAYTHFRITLHAFECELVAGQPQAIGVADWRWVTLDDLASFPFAVTDQKIIAALQKTVANS